MKWFRFPRLIGVVVAVYLVAVTVLFARLSMENHSFLREAASTQGTVTALVPRTFSGTQRPPTSHRDRGVPLAPEIRYSVAGVSYTYTPSHGRYKPNVKVGDQVTIIYDPDDPEQTARIKGEGRVVIPVITGGFGLVTLLVVGGLVFTRRMGLPNATRKASPHPGGPREGHDGQDGRDIRAAQDLLGTGPAGPTSASTPVRPHPRTGRPV